MGSRVASVVPNGVAFFKSSEPRDNRERARGLRRTQLKRKKRLNLVGRLRKVTQEVYRKKRDQFMRDNPICQYPNCPAPSFDPHHGAGRGGKNYLDTSTWFALCRKHHDWVHAHPNQARAIGLLKDF